jgi:hypothetical protein
MSWLRAHKWAVVSCAVFFIYGVALGVGTGSIDDKRAKPGMTHIKLVMVPTTVSPGRSQAGAGDATSTVTSTVTVTLENSR